MSDHEQASPPFEPSQLQQYVLDLAQIASAAILQRDFVMRQLEYAKKEVDEIREGNENILRLVTQLEAENYTMIAEVDLLRRLFEEQTAGLELLRLISQECDHNGDNNLHEP